MTTGMDYMDLLSMAEANSRNKQRELERRQLKQSKEKKMDPKQVKLNIGVQRFLQKKAEEERQKKEEAMRKKRQLMEIRNQDRKATSRVRRMINMTKSANKSCIADADDCLKDSMIAQAEEEQPDADDYGYTSQYASDMYKKIREKYTAEAKKEKFPTNPRIQNVKSLFGGGESQTQKGNRGKEELVETEKSVKLKPKKKMPPIESYEALLELAKAKSQEPIVIKAPVKEAVDPEKYEFGRPMTKKEKQKYLEEQELKRRALAAFSKNGTGFISAPAPTEKYELPRPARPSGLIVETDKKKMKEKEKGKEKVENRKASGEDSRVGEKRLAVSSEKNRPLSNGGNMNRGKEVSWREPQKTPKATDFRNREPAVKRTNEKFSKREDKLCEKGKNRSPIRYKTLPPKPKPPPPPQAQPRRDKPHKARPIIESDEDCDSEMDDFIDDSDLPAEDISSFIGQIFKYNKQKYVNEESDDECMESNFAQQQREEQISYRIGVQEDLEDMKMEQEEKRRKALMQKKKKFH